MPQFKARTRPHKKAKVHATKHGTVGPLKAIKAITSRRRPTDASAAEPGRSRAVRAIGIAGTKNKPKAQRLPRTAESKAASDDFDAKLRSLKARTEAAQLSRLKPPSSRPINPSVLYRALQPRLVDPTHEELEMLGEPETSQNLMPHISETQLDRIEGTSSNKFGLLEDDSEDEGAPPSRTKPPTTFTLAPPRFQFTSSSLHTAEEDWDEL